MEQIFLTRMPLSSRRSDGFGLMKLSCGGIWSFFRTMIALIMLAIPLADSRCPILDLTLPYSQMVLVMVATEITTLRRIGRPALLTTVISFVLPASRPKTLEMEPIS